MSSLCLSILMPAASSSKVLDPSRRSLSAVDTLCERALGLSRGTYQLFALVPLEESHLDQSTNFEVAVRLTESSFSMRNVEDIIANKEKYRVTLEKTNEAMLTYVQELKSIKRFITESSELENEEISKERILRKAMKCKQLQEDNKKLRKLIK